MRTRRIALVLAPAAAIVLAAAQVHVVRTRDGLTVIRKWQAALGDTYVDARQPSSGDGTAPGLALTLLFRGETDFLQPAFASTAAATAPDALARGVRYVAASQQPDGSWRSFNSRSPRFSRVREQPRIFPTAVVLLSLRDVPSVEPAVIARGREYLRRQMRDDYLWAVDGREHELSTRWDRLPCRMPPDADDTALAWLLLAPELGRDALRRVHQVFAQHEQPDGLYPTYFTGLGEPNTCPPDYANRPSLGVNVDVLAFFEHSGLDTSRLLRGLERRVQAPRYWERAVYYRSVSVLAFLAALAVANGAPSAEPLLDRFLTDHEASVMPSGTPVSPLERAAYVAAASERCRRRRLDCAPVQPDVAHLVRLQRRDGSWPAAPLYQASQGYYGSPAETTAIAVRALHNWSQAQSAARGAATGTPASSTRMSSSERVIRQPG